MAYSWLLQVGLMALQACVLATSLQAHGLDAQRGRTNRNTQEQRSLLQGRAKRLWLRALPPNPRAFLKAKGGGGL